MAEIIQFPQAVPPDFSEAFSVSVSACGQIYITSEREFPPDLTFRLSDLCNEMLRQSPERE